VRNIKILLCGVGGVGKAFLELLAERGHEIGEKFGLNLILTGAADIGGAAITSKDNGIPPAELLDHLRAGSVVEDFREFGRRGMKGAEAIKASGGHALIEATPTNLTDGEPGTTHVLASLNQGMEVVSANKGPFVLYYEKLHTLARGKNCGLHISAATAAALPTLDVGQICLSGAHVQSVEGILNGTTNYILSRMKREGCTYDEALTGAQELGIAETDPSYDVDGLDTANKIILISNRVFGSTLSPRDIDVQGIRGITPEDMASATEEGKVMKLIGTSEVSAGRVQARVAPRLLAEDHPLAAVNGSEKAVSYITDTMGRITVTGGKSSPLGAAAALLKDLINAFV
jgi:homoserine dehydrogenase